MEFRLIETGKEKYMELLLLGDEQEDMIARYLHRGELTLLWEDAPVAAAVMTKEGKNIFELKNIAVDVDRWRQGYGKMLVAHLCKRYGQRGNTVYVGTGETAGMQAFYHGCGFVYSHKIENFFLEHYDHPIVEEGVVLRDMVYYKRMF